ncbi:sporulation-specific protein 22 [Basidiobolus ranarum]|uniref:Sporulation-specific protein 22 n=1 Tax=Basidiobolus ranarum TaxID=34480 RepID=A0ABR2VZ29_9FUNG
MCSASQILFSRNVSKTNQRNEILSQALRNIDEYQNIEIYTNNTAPSKRKISEEGKEINEQLIVLKFEAKVKLQLWGDLYEIIQYADGVSEDLNVHVFERIADIILRETECPLTVLLLVTQAVLDNILKKELVDYVKFSHWFRIIVMTAIKNDADAAYQFFIQIQDILKNCDKGDYPQTEIEWLTVTAWNKGIEFYGQVYI